MIRLPSLNPADGKKSGAMKYELVEGYGAAIQKHSERLIINTPVKNDSEKTRREVPVLRLDHLLVSSKGVSISSDAIDLCCERGIPITIISRTGKPIGKFTSPSLHGSCQTRRAQLDAYKKSSGVDFAKSIIIGKLSNQSANLKYFAKNRKSKNPEAYRLLNEASDLIEKVIKQIKKVTSENINECRNYLMNREGECAKLYWNALSKLYGNKTEFVKREHRGAKNPLNAALNYAYGVLTSEIWTACLIAGLEPYAGILHVDRPGRLSFVLDLVEEFRPIVGDRIVFALSAKGWKIELEENGWLTYEAKRRLLDNLEEKFETPEPYNGKRVKLRNIIQLQAHLASQHFMEKKKYKPFIQRW